MDNVIYTPGGLAILRYFQPTPKLVKVGNASVFFDCQYGISLAFVSEELVAPLLAVLGVCCGKKSQIIFLASETQYLHWQFGKGGR